MLPTLIALSRRGIAKERFNVDDNYAYRSIDDIMFRLSPLLVEHKLCVLPRVLERTVAERRGLLGELQLNACIRVAYDLVAVEDGSTHTIEVVGEALDASDKATAKAFQSAFKYALIQAFAIPVSGSEDADARTPHLAGVELPCEPTQGWDQWCADIGEVIRRCRNTEAIARAQTGNRELLAALQRERPDLYSKLGSTIAERNDELGCIRSAHQAGKVKLSRSNVAKGSGTGSPPRQQPSAPVTRPRRRGASRDGNSARIEIAHA